MPSRVTGAKRRLSTSTRLRFTPKPRRFTICAPTLKLPQPLLVGVLLGLKAGSWLTAAPRLVTFSCSRVAALSCVTGVGVLKPELIRREPVTMTSCSSSTGLVSAAKARLVALTLARMAMTLARTAEWPREKEPVR